MYGSGAAGRFQILCSRQAWPHGRLERLSRSDRSTRCGHTPLKGCPPPLPCHEATGRRKAQCSASPLSSPFTGTAQLCRACWTPKESGGGWWKDNVLDENGDKTPRYWMLKEVNAEIHSIAKDFMRYRPIGTTLVGGDAEDELDSKGRVRIRRTNEFADGFVTGLQATDGSRLAIGARVSRHGGTERGRAYFVTACGDLVDEKRAVHEVMFSSVLQARVLGADGPVPLTKRPDGTFAFQLADSRAVLIMQ